MNETLTTVEAFLARGGRIWTRLRERGAGDVLDLMPLEHLAFPGMSPTAVVAALVTLEQRGVVRRACARVHPQDSTEYHVMWGLA